MAALYSPSSSSNSSNKKKEKKNDVKGEVSDIHMTNQYLKAK